MERYNSRIVDELNRISIPSGLRKELCINTGDKFSLTVVGTITVMQKVEGDAGSACAICEINDLGLITLPAEVRQPMGWKERDSIALYHTDNLLILKSATKK